MHGTYSIMIDVGVSLFPKKGRRTSQSQNLR